MVIFFLHSAYYGALIEGGDALIYANSQHHLLLQNPTRTALIAFQCGVRTSETYLLRLQRKTFINRGVIKYLVLSLYKIFAKFFLAWQRLRPAELYLYKPLLLWNYSRTRIFCYGASSSLPSQRIWSSGAALLPVSGLSHSSLSTCTLLSTLLLYCFALLIIQTTEDTD